MCPWRDYGCVGQCRHGTIVISRSGISHQTTLHVQYVFFLLLLQYVVVVVLWCYYPPLTTKYSFPPHNITQTYILLVNSPGGSVTAGLAIYDTMQYIQPSVHTIAMGQAASMGSLLLAGGAAGHRYALVNARLMVHQPSGGAQGMASDIQIRAHEILRLKSRLNDLYVHHTHQPLSEIERLMDRDSFLDTTQAMERGLIDQVLTQRVVVVAAANNNEEGNAEEEDDGSTTT